MFSYEWNLADGYPAEGVDHHGTTVMSTFACGGGSTMGYKLAGYDVVAANDIDPQMAKVYQANHHPKQFFLDPIKELLKRDDLPEVDILDGSPPCSSFSMAGSREKAWQKDKIFREGQAKQVLDDLFFDFIALAEKMQPKIVIAENVKGMLAGNAKGYTKEVVKRFNELGYTCQVFLLNAAFMGVPQRRERVFFVAHKTDKKLKLEFSEPRILFRDVEEVGAGKKITGKMLDLWHKKRDGEKDLALACQREYNQRAYFGTKIQHKKDVPFTIIASSSSPIVKADEPITLSKKELCRIGSFPLDYDFGKVQPKYLIGMSVPPVMMAQVAHQVYNQLIKEGQ